MPLGPLSARDAANSASDFVGRMNRGRRMPRVVSSIESLKTNTVHVFNVGPWEHSVPMGSYGTYIIPKCPEGQPYVAMKPLPGIMEEAYVKDESEYGIFHEDTRDWARELLGDGPMRSSAYSLRHFGCFVAEGKTPTKAELAEANRLLLEKCKEYVLEAELAYAAGAKESQAIIRPEVHFVAARVLNMTDAQWMIRQNPQGRQKCPVCGTLAEPEVMKCGNCKEHVFRPKEYAAYQASQKAS